MSSPISPKQIQKIGTINIANAGGWTSQNGNLPQIGMKIKNVETTSQLFYYI